MAFGPNAVDFQLRFWIADAPNGVQNIKSAVLLEMWRLFREHGIPLARPQHDVFLHRAAEETAVRAPEPAPLGAPFAGKRLGSVP